MKRPIWKTAAATWQRNPRNAAAVAPARLMSPLIVSKQKAELLGLGIGARSTYRVVDARPPSGRTAHAGLIAHFPETQRRGWVRAAGASGEAKHHWCL